MMAEYGFPPYSAFNFGDPNLVYSRRIEVSTAGATQAIDVTSKVAKVVGDN
jgi:hypothetical protein